MQLVQEIGKRQSVKEEQKTPVLPPTHINKIPTVGKIVD